MSYILDALKKLEKERRRGRIPGLSEQDSVVYHSRQRPLWPYILIAVFLLNAALFFWWLAPVKQKSAPSVAAPAAPPAPIVQERKDTEQRPESSKAAAPAAVQTETAAPTRDAELRERLLSLRKKMDDDARKEAQPAAAEPKAEPEKERKAVAAAPEKKPEAPREPVPEKKLYKLSELPPSIRESLPAFSISAFLYAENPSGRMARINDRMMREGRELESGIRVEEILPDGVILSYRKFHFLISVKQ